MPIVTDFNALIFDDANIRLNADRTEGAAVVVTFSFDDLLAELPNLADFSGLNFGAFTTGFANAAAQAAVRDALDLFEAAAGIRFVEVADGGMLQFAEATNLVTLGASNSTAETPLTSATTGSLGHVVMNSDHFPLDSGTEGFRILLQQIGQALGLDQSANGTNTLDPALDLLSNTVMKTIEAGETATALGALDEDALSHLYGAADAFDTDGLTLSHDVANAEIDVLGTELANVFVAPNFDTNISVAGGDDIVFGNAAADEVDGGAGDDQIFGGAGDHILRGGAGADTLDGLGLVSGDTTTGSADQMFGGDGDDTLMDSADALVFDGGDGRDTIDASNRSSTTIDFQSIVQTFTSIENVLLSPGNDVFTGATGNDEAHGGAGADQLTGDAGDDLLFGDAGIDTLNGGEGDDELDGGAGADAMSGLAGNDLYFVDDVADTIVETSGTDRVITSVAFTLSDGVENGTAITGAALTGNAGANTLNGGGIANTLNGGAGDDILLGRGGADTMNGGDGADRMNGGEGADVMVGGADNDIYDVDNVNDSVIEGQNAGIDRINTSVNFTNALNVEFLVGMFAEEKLTLDGNNNRDVIVGSAAFIDGGDRLSGNGGNDKLVGLVGNDFLNGGDGNDRIFGNSGDDIIDGGLGNDRISGNQGADEFVITQLGQRDTIVDMELGIDKIDLTDFGFASAAEALALASDVGVSTVFDFAGPASLVVQGVLTAAIGADDLLI